MHLTLIYPAVGRKEGMPYVRAWQMEPLAIAVLAGLTPPDVEIRFYDDRFDEIPLDKPTDLVAISVETFTALRAYRIAREFRARGVPVVMGGYHVTLMPEEAATEADAIVIGDAEPVWQQVLDDAEHRRLRPVYRTTQPVSLAGIRPRREIFAGKDYMKLTLVEFSRGCNFRCDFCSITAFHNATQNQRPPQEVVAEMEATGSRRFFVVDDNVVSQPQKAREFCRELTRLNVDWVAQASIHIARDEKLLDLMVKSGCRGLLIGMESLDPQTLRAMGKHWNLKGGGYAESLQRIRRHGLAIYGTFVFGYDNDDRETIERSLRFAKQQKLFLSFFNHLVPFPGTPFYRRLKEEGRLLNDRWWLDPAGRIGDVNFQPARLSADELKEYCLDARRRFFGVGSIFRRFWDFQANARNPKMASLYLWLNWQSHGDIGLRQGLRLGAGKLGVGRQQREPVDEPVPV